MAGKSKTLLFFIMIIFLVLATACETRTGEDVTVTPKPSSPGGGPCGDGVCDGPENQQNCPQDCSPKPDDVTPTPTIPSVPSVRGGGGGQAGIQTSDTPLWRSSLGACPGKQEDDFYASFVFTWTVDAEGIITGSGEGTMRSEPVARCPDTDYGGVKTPNPFPVSVTGSVTEVGYHFNLTATDLSQYHFTSGEVYHQGCILCWIFPEFKGVDTGGDLTSFTLPMDIKVGDQFDFELDYHIPQEGYTNDHVGSGVLEILALYP